MLALLIIVAFSLTANRLNTTKITPEELKDMLDSDGWY